MKTKIEFLKYNLPYLCVVIFFGVPLLSAELNISSLNQIITYIYGFIGLFMLAVPAWLLMAAAYRSIFDEIKM
jgi:hypothetical protein